MTLLYLAREAYLEQYGLSEANINGYVLLTANLNIDYLNMAHLGEEIHIELSVTQKNKLHVHWQYVVHGCKNNSIIAKAESTSLCYSLQKSRVVRAANLFDAIENCSKNSDDEHLTT